MKQIGALLSGLREKTARQKRLSEETAQLAAEWEARSQKEQEMAALYRQAETRLRRLRGLRPLGLLLRLTGRYRAEQAERWTEARSWEELYRAAARRTGQAAAALATAQEEQNALDKDIIQDRTALEEIQEAIRQDPACGPELLRREAELKRLDLCLAELRAAVPVGEAVLPTLETVYKQLDEGMMVQPTGFPRSDDILYLLEDAAYDSKKYYAFHRTGVNLDNLQEKLRAFRAMLVEKTFWPDLEYRADWVATFLNFVDKADLARFAAPRLRENRELVALDLLLSTMVQKDVRKLAEESRRRVERIQEQVVELLGFLGELVQETQTRRTAETAALEDWLAQLALPCSHPCGTEQAPE